MKHSTEEKKVMEKTLERLSRRRKAPTSVFVILIIMYVIVNIIVATTSGSRAETTVFGARIPVSAFAGILSALSNISVIFMAFYYGKKGYLSALGLLVVQFPLILIRIFVLHNTGSLPGVFGNLLTITAITIIYFNNRRMEEYQATLRDQAVTDRLTGLPNRFACSELLTDLVQKGDKFAVVSIDINGFKGINDTMGFETGNDLLCEIAMRWKTIADTGLSGTLDFITRIGGDEFVLIIKDYKSDEELLNTIKKYESMLNNRLTFDDCDLYITASFGYAEFPKDADTKDSVLTCANEAMHEIKNAHSSDHILRFTPDILKTERTFELEAKIREALKDETIYFDLQPQFDMKHELRGFEALARMKNEDGTLIPPGEFIPVAEKVGLVDKVDAMVFKKSAMFFGELIKNTGVDITLSVNASVRHLMKNDFLDEIKEVLNSSGLPAKNLEIEITESIMIDSVDKALQCIGDIKAMGIKIAIDDFGTGYSSLSYLNKFPADLIKVDKSFIDKMDQSKSSRQYVSAIISIGHIMGFDVISEGVEQPEQVEVLKEIGCDYIQGFIWGRPMPPEDAEMLVVKSLCR